MSCKMFNSRQRGFPCVSAKLNRLQPVGLAPPMTWGSFIGDITSLRSKMGFLLPPSVRFIHSSYSLDAQKMTSQKKTYKDVIAYLIAIHRERMELNRPYYVDPYGRDRQPLPEVVSLKAAPAQKPEKRPKTETKKANPKAALLKMAMEEAALRRENKRRQDAMLWGTQTVDEKEKEFFADVKPPSPRQVSPHLYKPKNVRVKSEWTKNLEMALAATRKKDVDERVTRKMEKINAQGDLVRIKMNDQMAERYRMIVTKMAEESERFTERMKQIRESRRPMSELATSTSQIKN